MAAYFGEGARSRRVLRDEDILKLIQDGNDSDIEELHDDGEDFFDPDIAPLSPGHPQHLLTPQEQSSNEVVIQNFTTGRTVTWKQTTFNDKEHNYPCQPSGLMIPFTGRCPLRQVVKNKPRPTGLKNFVTTTSDGLMVDFEIYKGANTMFGDKSLGLGPSVVLHLIKTIPPGSCVFHDRQFH
ncbi:hypothetical protein evm_003501 [Chilo suppressalis]|nr:hypothetical protein evm_003501 [Chilo suppressalis]